MKIMCRRCGCSCLKGPYGLVCDPCVKRQQDANKEALRACTPRTHPENVSELDDVDGYGIRDHAEYAIDRASDGGGFGE